MEIPGLESKAIGYGTSPINRKKYNGIEFNSDFDLNDYEAFYRNLDPQIGRWWQIDPRIEEYQESTSPYASMANDPIKNKDPQGDCPICGVVGAAIGGVVSGAIEAGSQLYHSGKITSWKAVGGATLQGSITGGVAGITGGASLLVSVTTNAAANVVGGVVNRAVQGKGTSLKDVAVDAAIGGGFAAAGKMVGNLVEKGASKLTRNPKGDLGEAITKVRYAARGYFSQGEKVVETGAKTAVKKLKEAAHYDHDLKQIFTGKRLTVENKFDKGSLNAVQRAARKNVTTEGGLIVDKSTSKQVGNAAQSAVTGVGGQIQIKHN